MDIRSYLEKHELSQEQFAKLVGVTQPMVWQWLHKRRPISATAARDIDQATGGKVSREELRPDIFADPPRRRRAA